MPVYSIESVTAQLTDALTVITNATPLEGGTAQNFASTDLSEQDLNLNASSTIPVSKRCLRYQFSNGVDTLNLTAIDDVLFSTQDFSNGGGSSTPDRIQFLKIINKGANVLVIEPGDSNPYYFDAAGTSYKIVVPAGGSVKLRLNNVSKQVSSTCETIKLTGTAADVYWILLLGG